MSAQAARRVDPSTIVSTNPGRNYEVVGEVRVSSAAEIAVAARQASAAQSTWQGCGVGRPCQGFGPVVSLFEEHRQESAEIVAREMGLPATQADGATCWTLDHMRWRTTARKTWPKESGNRFKPTIAQRNERKSQ
jgi:acyl-CoA reductase-like NAD-dependent aldehyde dehydrogenase